jgi:hypothetical protein
LLTAPLTTLPSIGYNVAGLIFDQAVGVGRSELTPLERKPMHDYPCKFPRRRRKPVSQGTGGDQMEDVVDAVSA